MKRFYTCKFKIIKPFYLIICIYYLHCFVLLFSVLKPFIFFYQRVSSFILNVSSLSPFLVGQLTISCSTTLMDRCLSSLKDSAAGLSLKAFYSFPFLLLLFFFC